MKYNGKKFRRSLLDGDFLQDGLLLDVGTATLKRIMARERYGDLGEERIFAGTKEKKRQ